MILIEPFIRPHKNKTVTVSRSQLRIFHSYNNMLGAIRVLFFMCEDGAGQFHHSKAANRIYGCFFMSYFFTWLADFLVGDAPECRVQ